MKKRKKIRKLKKIEILLKAKKEGRIRRAFSLLITVTLFCVLLVLPTSKLLGYIYVTYDSEVHANVTVPNVHGEDLLF